MTLMDLVQYLVTIKRMVVKLTMVGAVLIGFKLAGSIEITL